MRLLLSHESHSDRQNGQGLQLPPIADHKKAPQIAGLFHKTGANYPVNPVVYPVVYMDLTWLLSRDLCRAALFLGMMPFATERSIAGTAAL